MTLEVFRSPSLTDFCRILRRLRVHEALVSEEPAHGGAASLGYSEFGSDGRCGVLDCLVSSSHLRLLALADLSPPQLPTRFAIAELSQKTFQLILLFNRRCQVAHPTSGGATRPQLHYQHLRQDLPRGGSSRFRSWHHSDLYVPSPLSILPHQLILLVP